VRVATLDRNCREAALPAAADRVRLYPVIEQPMDTVGGPSSPLQYRADPDDGAHLWANSVIPRAAAAERAPGEVCDHCGCAHHDAGYRLAQLGRVTLPVELSAGVEAGPDVLDTRIHPLTPSLVSIRGVDGLAMRRTFGASDLHVTLLSEQWVLAICPTGTRPTLA